MSSTSTPLADEPTQFDPDNPTGRSRIVLTATIGGVCILAITAAIIAIKLSRWLRGRSDRQRRRRILNKAGRSRKNWNAWDVDEWEGTPA